MSRSVDNPWLTRFAFFTAACTLLLICVGGVVTSKGVGMAVPDWPTTYGYNMFFFPFSKWIGGIFYEHAHRLIASAVGLLTTVLALWLYGRRSRSVMRWGGIGLLVASLALALRFPQRPADAAVAGAVGLISWVASSFWPIGEPAPGWLRRLGVLAFVGVVLQGLLGGLRVTLFKDEIGIFHATLAQLFFVLVGAIALFTTRWWQNAADTSAVSPLPGPLPACASRGEGEDTGALPSRFPLPTSPSRGEGQGGGRPQAATRCRQPGDFVSVPDRAGLRVFFLATTALILLQLVLGATMRHQHAGLAIPDFPAAYGRIWPAMDVESVAAYNRNRLELTALDPITAFQIGLQMTHRLMALLILIAVTACAVMSARQLGRRSLLTRLALGWFGMILVQIFLGAATIWTDKSADVATAHVATGALSLVTGALLTLIGFRCLARDGQPQGEVEMEPATPWRAGHTPHEA